VDLSHALIERAGQADVDTSLDSIEPEKEKILAGIHCLLLNFSILF